MSNNKLAYDQDNAPATLHRVMREAIGRQLKVQYEVPKTVPHELLVLLLQINEQQRPKARNRG